VKLLFIGIIRQDRETMGGKEGGRKHSFTHMTSVVLKKMLGHSSIKQFCQQFDPVSFPF